jgi:thiamine transporter ThiT
VKGITFSRQGTLPPGEEIKVFPFNKTGMIERNRGYSQPGGPPRYRMGPFLETAMAVAMAAMFVLTLGALRIPASIPVFFLSYRRGPAVAALAGVAVGLMVLLVRPMYLHPVVFLEAPLEYAVIAVAGFFPPGKEKRGGLLPWLFDRRGIILAAFLRFAVTLVGSYIIYSYYFSARGGLIWAIAFLDEGPLFVPYLILATVLIPYLTGYRYLVHELK